MSSDSSKTLRDFVTLQRGTTYKGNLLGLPGPVLLGLASIEPNGGFRRGAFKTYGGDSPAKITLTPGEIYVSLKDVTQSGDLLGSVSRVPVDIKQGRLTQDTVKLDFQGEPISHSYIYWLLRTPAYREYCRGRGTGTTTLGLARDDFLNFPVPEPTNVELSLVELLEGIENRIALLRETNATLEAIAQALFKSWFVDFDPVHAKQQGRAPEGMSKATAALFPDSFEESELGLVPRGWEIRKAETLLTRLSTKVRYTKEQVSSSGATPVYEQGAGILLGYHDSPAQFAATPNEPMFIFGDHTCVTHLSCEPFDISMNVVPLKGSDRSTLWTYYAIKDKQTFQEYRRHWMELAIKEIVVAPKEICDQFSIIASNLHVKMESNTWQANTLATLRDTLLPRLISGQLRLPEAEAALEAVAG